MVATIILVFLNVLGLGIAFGMHGEYREINGWVSLTSFIITMILYYYAGLFNNFNYDSNKFRTE